MQSVLAKGAATSPKAGREAQGHADFNVLEAFDTYSPYTIRTIIITRQDLVYY